MFIRKYLDVYMHMIYVENTSGYIHLSCVVAGHTRVCCLCAIDSFLYVRVRACMHLFFFMCRWCPCACKRNLYVSVYVDESVCTHRPTQRYNLGTQLVAEATNPGGNVEDIRHTSILRVSFGSSSPCAHWGEKREGGNGRWTESKWRPTKKETTSCGMCIREPAKVNTREPAKVNMVKARTGKHSTHAGRPYTAKNTPPQYHLASFKVPRCYQPMTSTWDTQPRMVPMRSVHHADAVHSIHPYPPRSASKSSPACANNERTLDICQKTRILC